MQIDYLSIFRHMPYTSIVFGADFSIVEATDKYLEMTQRTREEILGRDVFEAFPDNPDDPTSKNTGLLRKSIMKAMESGEPDEMDLLRYDIPKPESEGGGFSTRYWDVTHVPVKDEHGNIKYIIQKTGDATERILTQNALHESEEQIKFILESMPQLIWINKPSGEVTFLNKRWDDYSGIKTENLINNTWDTLVHPEDRETSRNAWTKALSGKDNFQVYTRLKNKDGNYRWFLSRAVPKQNAQGEITYWVGSATDVHDTKIIVEELLQSNVYLAELSESVKTAYDKADMQRQTLEKLFMDAPAMICVLKGPEHIFELANPIYMQSLPGRELIGRTCAEAIPEALEMGFIDLLDRVYQNGETISGKEMKLPLDRKGTGEMEEAYFTFTYQPMYENEKITGVIAFAFEVTDNVILRRKIEELETKAQLS